MADINLERKDATIWPWIVGLLALALVIWGVWAATDGTNGEMAFDDQDQMTETQAFGDQEQEQTAEVPGSVRDFLNDCAVGEAPGQPTGQTGQAGQTGQQGQTGQTDEQDQMGQVGQMGQDDQDPAEYAENCIDQMITAMEDVADEQEANETVNEELTNLRDRADALGEDDSESLQYSQNVQSVLTSAANVLQQLQQTAPAGQQAQSEVQGMQQAAEEIQPDTPIAQQTQELSRVFQRAGTALQMMG